jgi:hypothetical protein
MVVTISRNGAEIGTWPKEDVVTFYRKGDLLSTDLFWTEGMPDWQPLAALVKPPQPPPSTSGGSDRRLDGARFVINAMLLVLVMVVVAVLGFIVGESVQRQNDGNYSSERDR